MDITIESIEYYLPHKRETRKELKLDNPSWRMDDIEEKTGVKIRHIAEKGETSVDLAEVACKKIMDNGVNREDIDFLVFITQSPDYALPTSACILQDRLGLNRSCMAFDVNLGCSGFVYGLALGGSIIESGLAKRGLIVCSETYSKYIAKDDRTCRPIFSDGSAAVLLSCSNDFYIGPFDLNTDGSGFQDLFLPESGLRLSECDNVKKKLVMNGSSVFMFTMDVVPDCVLSLLDKAKKTLDDIDLFVFHQASKLVIDNIIRRLDLPTEKVFTNYQEIGNTVSASIPIALKDAQERGDLERGKEVMLVGFGVGLSWGGCLVKWRGLS